MQGEEPLRIKEILDESIAWEPEVLHKMPKLFLLIRENYLCDRAETEKTTEEARTS